jgi:hypothetical protein
MAVCFEFEFIAVTMDRPSPAELPPGIATTTIVEFEDFWKLADKRDLTKPLENVWS